jgi:ribonuclease HI
MVYINTDGSCDCSSKEGGWSYIIEGKAFSGREWDTTNNRMELLAAIKALEHFNAPQEIIILSDSQYVVQGISKHINGWLKNGWKNYQNKPVKNQDLWENLLVAKKNHNQVLFKWVPRENNTGADIAAKKARGVNS